MKLGDYVKDKITGFEGVAVARAEYLNGCIFIQVQPVGLKDGKIIESEWIDEQRITEDSQATVGGPQSRPPKIHSSELKIRSF